MLNKVFTGTKLEATLGSLNMLPVNNPKALPIRD